MSIKLLYIMLIVKHVCCKILFVVSTYVLIVKVKKNSKKYGLLKLTKIGIMFKNIDIMCTDNFLFLFTNGFINGPKKASENIVCGIIHET